MGFSSSNETAHLHKLGDFAVALCRTPEHTILIFSLPNCQLLHHTKLSGMGSIERPLEEDDLDPRFLMKNNTMMFMFHHPLFFFDEDDILMVGNQANDENNVRRYGRFLFVDFTNFLASQKHRDGGEGKANIPPVQRTLGQSTANLTTNNNTKSKVPLLSICVDEQFDCNDDHIEKMSVLPKDRMVCVMSSGNIILRDMVPPKSNTFMICSHYDKLSVPCPLGLKVPGGESDTDSDGYESDENESEGNGLDTLNNGALLSCDVNLVCPYFLNLFPEHLYYTLGTDLPTLCASRDGDMILVMRHFKDGRKIHTYDTNEGKLLYEINIDADPRLRYNVVKGVNRLKLLTIQYYVTLFCY